jgi:hypothetical protein
MSGTEPSLPQPTVSNLLAARNVIRDCFEAWLHNWRKTPTVGHAGVVTWEFIRAQAGMAPRAIVTVLDGDADRIMGGKAVQSTPTWAVYLLTRGRIKDRTDDGLNLVGEALRFIFADPFGAVDKGIFCKPPQVGSLAWKSLYTDKDEKLGYSIWRVTWRSEIALGTAGRERPGAGLLLRAAGFNLYEGTVAQPDVEFEVEGLTTAVSTTTAAMGSAEAYIATAAPITITISSADIIDGHAPLQFLALADDTGGTSTAGVVSGGGYTGDDGDYPATQAASSGLGSGAEFTLTVAGGVVTGVATVDAPGSGYRPGEFITTTISVVGLTQTLSAVLSVTSTTPVTIDTEGGQAIDGQASVTLTQPNERLTLAVTRDGNLESVS